jgi:hypothetical protein
LPFLGLNILFCAGVDIFGSNSVWGTGVRFYGSDL